MKKLRRMKHQNGSSGSASGATLGFEAKLWAAASKLRGHMGAAEWFLKLKGYA